MAHALTEQRRRLEAKRGLRGATEQWVQRAGRADALADAVAEEQQPRAWRRGGRCCRPRLPAEQHLALRLRRQQRQRQHQPAAAATPPTACMHVCV